MKNKILIVDDEKNIRTTLTYFLSEEEYEIDTADDGEQAISILIGEEKRYDLVLLDIKMPCISGMDVLRRLRASKNNTNIIMMTAYGTVKEAVEAMKLNVIDFISKPFSLEEIKKIIIAVLSRENLTENTLYTFEQYIEFAKLNITNNNFIKAEEILKQAIGKNVISPESYNLLGIIAEYNGNFEIAQKYYRAALAFDPSYKLALANLERITDVDCFNF